MLHWIFTPPSPALKQLDCLDYQYNNLSILIVYLLIQIITLEALWCNGKSTKLGVSLHRCRPVCH